MGRGKEGSQRSASQVGTVPARWAPGQLIRQHAAKTGVERTPGFSGRHEDTAGRASCPGTMAQRLVPGEEGTGVLGTSLGSSPKAFPNSVALTAGSEQSLLDLRAASAPGPRTKLGSSITTLTGNQDPLPKPNPGGYNLPAQQDQALVHLPGQQGGRQTDRLKDWLPCAQALSTSFPTFLSVLSAESLCTINSKDFTHSLNLGKGYSTFIM